MLLAAVFVAAAAASAGSSHSTLFEPPLLRGQGGPESAGSAQVTSDPRTASGSSSAAPGSADGPSPVQAASTAPAGAAAAALGATAPALAGNMEGRRDTGPAEKPGKIMLTAVDSKLLRSSAGADAAARDPSFSLVYGAPHERDAWRWRSSNSILNEVKDTMSDISELMGDTKRAMDYASEGTRVWADAPKLLTRTMARSDQAAAGAMDTANALSKEMASRLKENNATSIQRSLEQTLSRRGPVARPVGRRGSQPDPRRRA